MGSETGGSPNPDYRSDAPTASETTFRTESRRHPAYRSAGAGELDADGLARGAAAAVVGDDRAAHAGAQFAEALLVGFVARGHVLRLLLPAFDVFVLTHELGVDRLDLANQRSRHRPRRIRRLLVLELLAALRDLDDEGACRLHLTFDRRDRPRFRELDLSLVRIGLDQRAIAPRGDDALALGFAQLLLLALGLRDVLNDPRLLRLVHGHALPVQLRTRAIDRVDRQLVAVMHDAAGIGPFVQCRMRPAGDRDEERAGQQRSDAARPCCNPGIDCVRLFLHRHPFASSTSQFTP